MKLHFKLLAITLGLLVVSFLLSSFPNLFNFSWLNQKWGLVIFIVSWLGPIVTFWIAGILGSITAILLIRKEKFKGVLYASLIIIVWVALFFRVAGFKSFPVLRQRVSIDPIRISHDIQLVVNDTYQVQDTVVVGAINISSSTYQYSGDGSSTDGCNLSLLDAHQREVGITEFYCSDLRSFVNIFPNQTSTLITFKLRECTRAISNFGIACLKDKSLSPGKYTLQAGFFNTVNDSFHSITVQKSFIIQR